MDTETKAHSICWYDDKCGDAVTADILAGGDYCPISSFEKAIWENKPIFDNILQQEMKEKDIFLVNLEVPLCDTNLPGQGLRAHPDMASTLKAFGVDVVSLANNHIRDFHDKGVFQTFDTLRKHDISFIGAGENAAEADKMLIKNMNGLKIGIWALAEKEYNLATNTRPGTSYFFPEINVQKIPELKEQVDFLMIFVHAGHEFMLTPSPRIRTAYRDFIDAGADIVAGHHPHVIQGIEKYENGWIVYSLGNLVFDLPYVSSYKDTDHAFLLRIKIGKHKVHKIELIPYMIKPGITETMPQRKIAGYKILLGKLSNNIKDDNVFYSEWKKNVSWRWPDYRDAIIQFTENIRTSKKNRFLKIGRNFFQSPTHLELISEALDIIEDRII